MKLQPGMRVWAADTNTWGPELVEVLLLTDGYAGEKAVVRRECGAGAEVFPFECYPTLKDAIAGAADFAEGMAKNAERDVARYRAAAERIRRIGDSTVAPTPLAADLPLVVRISGADVTDLDDLPGVVLAKDPFDLSAADLTLPALEGVGS